MKSLLRISRYAWATTWYVFAGLVVVAAVGLTLSRVLLTEADQYRDNIAAWVSGFVHQPVALAQLDADWHGLEPGLILEDFRLLSKDSKSAFITFKKARIGINLLQSLRQFKVVPGTLTVEGAQLIIERDRNGRLAIAGMNSAEGNTANNQLLSDWLLRQKLVDIRKSTVVWRDLQQNQGDWAFNDVNLRLQNSGERHRLNGSVDLPKAIGEKLEFAMDLKGDILSGHDWSGSIYVSGLAIKPARWFKTTRHAGIDVSGGNLTMQLWSDWDRGRLLKSNGTFALENLQLQAPGARRLVVFETIGARFALEKQDQQWWLAADRVTVKRGGRVWPATQLKLAYQPADETHPLSVKGGIGYVGVNDIASVASLSTQLKHDMGKALRGMQPRGHLYNVKFDFQDDPAAQPTFTIDAGVRGYAQQAWRKLPGLTNIDAQLKLTESRGSLSIAAANARLDFPRLFRNSLTANLLTGNVAWHRDNDDWQVEANNINVQTRDAGARGRVALTLSPGQAPFVDLAMHFTRGDGAQKSRYLPVGIMSPNLVEWIDRSVIDASITDGGLLYFGRTDEFPFTQGQGKFEMRMSMDNGTLSYTPGWPEINDIKGELVYTGRSLSFEAEKGRIYDSRIGKTSIRIADLTQKPHLLTVNGDIHGPANNGLRFLHESPLEQLFAKHLAPFKLSGPSDIALSLDIPLAPDSQIGVRGNVEFGGKNALRAKEFSLVLENLRGGLGFTERGIFAQDMRARLDNMPIHINIDTQENSGVRTTRINGWGNANQDDVRGILKSYLDRAHWARYLKGETPWLAEIVIPHGAEAAEDAPPIMLRVDSSLAGIGVELPAPLAKSAETLRPFSVEMPLNGNRRVLRLDYGPHHTLMELVTVGKKTIIERAGIGLHTEPKLPAEHGMRFKGSVDRFSWSAWEPILFPPPGEIPLFEEDGPSVTQFYDVKIGELEIFGRRFNDVALQASNSAQGWTMHADSEDVAGTWFIPSYLSSAPLVMDMERIHIKSTSSGDLNAASDPRDLPAFKIISKDFRVDNIEFGRLELNSTRIPQGLRLDQLRLNTSHTRVLASGDWMVLDDAQTSRFNIDINSDDLGKTLRDWGYAGAVENGESDIKIAATWPGSPIAFNLEELSGTLQLKVNHGRLLDVEPGAARVFGLLSLQALPRRLTLDFSDMFAKGFSFDRISGEFAIVKGRAHTDGMFMEGPAARVKTVGDIDLGARQYDQVVTIMPRLGDSLPLLGAALTGVPQIGATILVMQKLFEKQLNQLGVVHYTVKGDWSNPTFTKIKKENSK